MCNLSEYVEERGIQQGLKEGEKKGGEQEKFATAERMLKAGFSDYDQIASITALKKSTIGEIAKKMA